MKTKAPYFVFTSLVFNIESVVGGGVFSSKNNSEFILSDA